MSSAHSINSINVKWRISLQKAYSYAPSMSCPLASHGVHRGAFAASFISNERKNCVGFNLKWVNRLHTNFIYLCRETQRRPALCKYTYKGNATKKERPEYFPSVVIHCDYPKCYWKRYTTARVCVPLVQQTRSLGKVLPCFFLITISPDQV